MGIPGTDAAPSSLGITSVAGLLALVPTVVAPLAVAVGLAGVLVLVLGVARGRARWAHVGGLALYAGVLIAGLVGAPVLALVVGTVGAVVAWDAATQAIGLGRHLHAPARSGGPGAVHTVFTAGVALLAAVGSYLLYRLAALPAPTVVVVVLLTGGLLLHQGLSRTALGDAD